MFHSNMHTPVSFFPSVLLCMQAEQAPRTFLAACTCAQTSVTLFLRMPFALALAPGSSTRPQRTGLLTVTLRMFCPYLISTMYTMEWELTLPNNTQLKTNAMKLVPNWVSPWIFGNTRDTQGSCGNYLGVCMYVFRAELPAGSISSRRLGN